MSAAPTRAEGGRSDYRSTLMAERDRMISYRDDISNQILGLERAIKIAEEVEAEERLQPAPAAPREEGA